MRTLRLSLVGTVMLMLLGGLSGAAVAQDDEDLPVTATHVTGKETGNRTISEGMWSLVDGADQLRDAVYENDIDWSDPRLPSLMRISENLHIRVLGDDREAWTWVSNIRLEGAEGAWTGPEYGLSEWVGDGLVFQPRMMLLSGEGAYEGLTAMIHRRWEADGQTLTRPVSEGFIFEGEMPPMPEPLEPLAE